MTMKREGWIILFVILFLAFCLLAVYLRLNQPLDLEAASATYGAAEFYAQLTAIATAVK